VGATIITTKTALTCRAVLNEVNLTWIKAHIGHKGNELDDKLAKNGTLKSTIRSCPAQIKLTTKQAILKVWQKEWNEHDKCGQTKVFFNTINTLLGKCNRQTIGTIIQFITGHCFLLRHQNQKINPQAGLPVICRLCKDPNTLETPEHLIRACPVLINRRREIFELVGL
jgi:hypothetical protein